MAATMVVVALVLTTANSADAPQNRAAAAGAPRATTVDEQAAAARIVGAGGASTTDAGPPTTRPPAAAAVEPLVDAAETLFVVGDSTFVEAQWAIGHGSAYPGNGYTPEAALGAVNSLDLPPAGFEGLVVMGVSLWDVWAQDLEAYVEATERYRSRGLGVVWVEVPPGGIAYQGGPLDPDLVALNERVADVLGCDLMPWSLRDVESAGSRDGDPEGDWVHPTPDGGAEMVARFAALTTADACVPA